MTLDESELEYRGFQIEIRPSNVGWIVTASDDALLPPTIDFWAATWEGALFLVRSAIDAIVRSDR